MINDEQQRIIYVSAPTQVSMTDWYYDIASLDHFWVRRRFEVLRRLAEGIIRKSTRIAEIGCGNGLLQRAIEDKYGIPVAGFELNEHALKKNVSRISEVYCYDIHQRAPEFHDHFDLLLLFDVLEHIENDGEFLQSIKYHLTRSGTLVINVPAHQALYSKYDDAAGHVRRYSMRSLTTVLEQNGLKARSITYWGLPLAPLVAARKAMLALRKAEQGIYTQGFDPGGKMINSILALLARCEPLPQRLFGTSLMAVVENQD